MAWHYRVNGFTQKPCGRIALLQTRRLCCAYVIFQLHTKTSELVMRLLLFTLNLIVVIQILDR